MGFSFLRPANVDHYNYYYLHSQFPCIRQSLNRKLFAKCFQLCAKTQSRPIELRVSSQFKFYNDKCTAGLQQVDNYAFYLNVLIKDAKLKKYTEDLELYPIIILDALLSEEKSDNKRKKKGLPCLIL